MRCSQKRKVYSSLSLVLVLLSFDLGSRDGKSTLAEEETIFEHLSEDELLSFDIDSRLNLGALAEEESILMSLQRNHAAIFRHGLKK